MPTFDSSGPIRATLDVPVGTVQVVAQDRPDTVVEVVPTDAGRRHDVLATDRTSVEFTDGRLQVRAATTWRRYSWSSDGGSVDVRICCPTGSDLVVTGAMTVVRTTGRLGQVRAGTSVGTMRVEQASTVRLHVAGLGDVTVGDVEHDAELVTACGAVRVMSIGAGAQVKNSNGDTWIGAIGGDAHLKAGNGDIVVEHARGPVTAKTANGDVRLGHVTGGAVTAESGCGRVDVGVGVDVAAWLDLQTWLGEIHNDLDATGAPASSGDSLRVRARSAAGDITVRRAEPSTPGTAVQAPTGLAEHS